MAGRSVGLLCLLFFVGWACAESALSSEVINGFFAGRSGDIIIHDKKTSHIAGHAIFVNQKDISQEIKESEVGDLISHLMGTAPLNTQRNREHFPKTNFFNLPRANLLIVLDAENVELSAFHKETKHTIIRESYPAYAISSLTSMLSGRTPSSHGIIGNKWMDNSGKTVNAYETWNTSTSFAANLQDLLTITYAGKSLVFSASASKEFARAIAAKPFVMSETSHNVGYFLQGESFSSIYPSTLPTFMVSRPAIETFFKAEKDVVEINLENSACRFNLSKKADFALLAEVAFIELSLQSFVNDNELNNLLRDNIPDMFSFAFTGIKGFEKGSHESKCALHLVDRTITNIIQHLNTVYDGAVMTEALFLNSALDQVVSPAIEQKLKEIVPGGIINKRTVGQFYPNIYFTEKISAKKRSRISESMGVALKDFDLETVTTPEYAYAATPEAMRVIQSLRQSNNSTTLSEAAAFQIVLWTAVMLIVAAIAASYIMMTIDPSTDTLLYSNDINHSAPRTRL